MNDEMGELKEYQQAHPFRPFRIHFSGGHHLEIHRPDALTFSPDGTTAIAHKPDDTFEVLELKQIVLITDLDNDWLLDLASE